MCWCVFVLNGVCQSQLENGSEQLVQFSCLQLHDENIRDMSLGFMCMFTRVLYICVETCVVAGGGYILPF